MKKISTRLSALALAALVLTTACGDDTVLEPTFGEGCTRGTLSAGQTVSGAFSPASCRLNYNFWSQDIIPYESWNVHLDAGKAYMFHLQQAPDPAQEGEDNVDALLTLWGKDDQGRSIPLAISDDDAGGVDGYDSEFWFIAPRSGDFVLVASSYSWESWGGYHLTMNSCPVLGTIDTAGTYTFATKASSCVRHNHPDYDGYDQVFAYSFIRIPADSFESLEVDVEHDWSDVVIEWGGPDFDTYSNIWDETDDDYNSGSNPSMSLGTGEVPGLVTLAVGTYYFNAPGTYTVNLSRSYFTAPAPARPWDGRFTMKATFPKSEAKRSAKR